MAGTVTIIENGRDGRVLYTEGLRSIDGYWEFGGQEVIVIASMGSVEDWQRSCAWAVERRSTILSFIAIELIRQRAPSCKAEVDEVTGNIWLHQGSTAHTSSPPPVPKAQATAFVHRYSKLKAMFGIGVLVVALIVAAVLWTGKKMLTVAPASGVPLNECVRTDKHIASFIQYTDPHLPNWSGRGGNTTTSISLLLIPLDGSTPKVIPVVSALDGNGYALSRIIGSDGRTLWFDCTGLFGVRLSDHELISSKDLRSANPLLDPKWWEDPRGMDILDGRLHILNEDNSAAMDVEPGTWKASSVAPKPSNARFERREPTDQLAAGLITSSGSWFGLHAPEELHADYQVKSWIERVESAEDAKRERRFFEAALEPSSDGEHHRILSIEPLSEASYLNAAFLRLNAKSEPLRLPDPESVLMIHTDKPGLAGKLIVSRVNVHGEFLWNTETGLDRFAVSQILPGTEAFAFVGTRPPVEGKLSEPLVVLVDNATGRLTVHSLWR